MDKLLDRFVGLSKDKALHITSVVKDSATKQLIKGAKKLDHQMDEVERTVRTVSRRQILKIATLGVGGYVVGKLTEAVTTQIEADFAHAAGRSPGFSSTAIANLAENYGNSGALEKLGFDALFDERHDDKRALDIALRFSRREAVDSADIDFLAGSDGLLPRAIDPLTEYQLRELASQILNRQGSSAEANSVLSKTSVVDALKRSEFAQSQSGIGFRLQLRESVSICNLALSATRQSDLDVPANWVNINMMHQFAKNEGPYLGISAWTETSMDFEFDMAALRTYRGNYVHAVYFLATPIINSSQVDGATKDATLHKLDSFYDRVRNAGIAVETTWQHTVNISAHLDRLGLVSPRDRFLQLALGKDRGRSGDETLSEIIIRRRKNRDDMQIRALVLLLETMRANGDNSRYLGDAASEGLTLDLLDPTAYCVPAFMSHEVVLSELAKERSSDEMLLRALIADNAVYEAYLTVLK